MRASASRRHPPPPHLPSHFQPLKVIRSTFECGSINQALALKKLDSGSRLNLHEDREDYKLHLVIIKTLKLTKYTPVDPNLCKLRNSLLSSVLCTLQIVKISNFFLIPHLIQ